MKSSLRLFKRNIEDAKNLASLHEYGEEQLKLPLNFDDLLRMELTYSVSAFDKLMHDLIRIGMVEIFAGLRSPTPRYLSETISMDLYIELTTNIFPPPEYYFERAIAAKLKQFSFLDPNKVADGLSLVWNEKHKWQKISEKFNSPEKMVRTTMKTIYDRRNLIVHEADFDPSTGSKFPISRDVARDASGYIEKLGVSIYDLIVQD